MHLYLEFESQQIRGEGTDYVGPWNLSGHYDLEQQIASNTLASIGLITRARSRLRESWESGISGRQFAAASTSGQFT